MDLSNCSFTRGPKIGKGGYGKIYTLYGPDGQVLAGKYQPIDPYGEITGLPTSLLVEIDALVRLRNVSEVIHLEGICYQENEVILILEKMDTDLYKYIHDTELDIRMDNFDHLLRSMIRAMALFELLNITHFDVKPHNILVKSTGSGPIFKITDFGLSRSIFSQVDLSETFFSRWYRPPEFFGGRPQKTFSAFSGDIWALGITLLEYILQYPITRADTDFVLLDKLRDLSSVDLNLRDFFTQVRTGKVTGGIQVENLLRKKSSASVSPQIILILEGMLKLNPDERLTATQILPMLGESISPEYLQQFIPPEYPRETNPRGINIIKEVTLIRGKGKIPTLIALEIYTRFLYIWNHEEHGNNSLPEDAFALAAARIAESLFYDIPSEDMVFFYSQIWKKDSSVAETIGQEQDIDVEQVVDAEKIILTTINFSIYNLNLGPVIDRAYPIDHAITNAPPEMFSQPLVSWFST